MQTRISWGFWVGPLGGATSAFYIVGKTLSLLQEINSQKHKARRAGLFEVSESGVCLLCVPGKRETRLRGTESPKQPSSLHVYPGGVLGRIPSETLTRVPIPPYTHGVYTGVHMVVRARKSLATHLGPVLDEFNAH